MELEGLKASLEQVEDPRRTNGGHILRKLENMIIIGLCTVVCGGEDFPDMEGSGQEREKCRGKSWNCLTKYLTVTHFGEYLSKLTPKHCQNVCMTGVDITCLCGS